VLSVGDVEGVGGLDGDSLFFGDSAEEIDFEGYVILDEAFESIADGDDAVDLDEFGGVSFEEGLGGGGLVSDHAVDHSNLLSIPGVNLFGLCADDLHVHVEAASMSLQILNFHEFGLSQFFVLSHIS
jgi:hypothetical protein